jgi:hypothetical protein
MRTIQKINYSFQYVKTHTWQQWAWSFTVISLCSWFTGNKLDLHICHTRLISLLNLLGDIQQTRHMRTSQFPLYSTHYRVIIISIQALKSLIIQPSSAPSPVMVRYVPNFLSTIIFPSSNPVNWHVVVLPACVVICFHIGDFGQMEFVATVTHFIVWKQIRTMV